MIIVNIIILLFDNKMVISDDVKQKDVNLEQQREAKAAKAKSWANFKMKCPNADLNRFKAQVYFHNLSKDNKASSEIYLKHSNGVEPSVSGSGRYWSDEMEKALGIGGCRIELTLNSNSKKPIPAVEVNKKS